MIKVEPQFSLTLYVRWACCVFSVQQPADRLTRPSHNIFSLLKVYVTVLESVGVGYNNLYIILIARTEHISRLPLARTRMTVSLT